MLARILIGLDRPKHATVLLELGIRWARRTGATLVAMGIVDEPGIRSIEPAFPVGGTAGVDPVYYMGYEARLADVHRQVGRLLNRFAVTCDEAGAAHTEMKVVGSPHERIEVEAQTCDLVLLARGSHFRFVAGDDEGDDTLKKVLKNAPRPIVVVPSAKCSEGPIVIAYDGSLQAARALGAFQATGLGESGEVHVVSVAASAGEAAVLAAHARKFLSRHKVEVIPHALPSSAPAALVILEQVQRLNAGLLVLGAYGQPVLREYFVGSVTQTALEQSPVPLFLYH
jgi:nucleotide-binding universal stress UspA family protein